MNLGPARPGSVFFYLLFYLDITIIQSKIYMRDITSSVFVLKYLVAPTPSVHLPCGGVTYIHTLR